MPVKLSFIPIIRRKLRHRFERGEACESLKAEAHELAEWIKGKAPSHQTPIADHIENKVRSEYRALKAAPKASIQ